MPRKASLDARFLTWETKEGFLLDATSEWNRLKGRWFVTNRRKEDIRGMASALGAARRGEVAMEVLKDELAFFDEKKQELMKTSLGQFALIKGRSLIGVFPTREQAYIEGVKRFCQEGFLIKQIVEHERVEQVPLLAYSIHIANI